MKCRIYFPSDDFKLRKKTKTRQFTHIVVPINGLTGQPFLSLARYFREDGSYFNLDLNEL
jgi:hypothetical protein